MCAYVYDIYIRRKILRIYFMILSVYIVYIFKKRQKTSFTESRGIKKVDGENKMSPSTSVYTVYILKRQIIALGGLWRLGCALW